MPIKKDTKQDTITINLDALKNQALNPNEELGETPTSISMMIQNYDTTDLLEIPSEFKVILFDYKDDFFLRNKKLLPKGYLYVFPTTVADLNDHLRTKDFQILILNYDVEAKAINAISGEVKKNLPTTKVLIASKAISPAKAEMHAKTPYGAAGYFQYPLHIQRLEQEFNRIHAEYRAKEKDLL